MDAEEAAIRAYCERGEEQDRLSDGRGQLEFIRTTEILAHRPHLLATAVLRAPGITLTDPL